MNLSKEVQPLQYRESDVTDAEKMQRLEWQPVRDDERRLWGLFSHPHMSAHHAQVFMTHRRKPTGSITLSHDCENRRRWLPSQALHLALVGMFAAIVQITLVRKQGPPPPPPLCPGLFLHEFTSELLAVSSLQGNSQQWADKIKTGFL